MVVGSWGEKKIAAAASLVSVSGEGAAGVGAGGETEARTKEEKGGGVGCAPLRGIDSPAWRASEWESMVSWSLGHAGRRCAVR